MTVFHAKTAAITALDATPEVRQQAGKGVAAAIKVADGIGTPTVSGDADSTIQLVRIPFSAIVKKVEAWSLAQTTEGQFALGCYYASDGSNALSKAILLAADTIDVDFFCTAAQFDADDQDAYVKSVPGHIHNLLVATWAVATNAGWAASEANTPLWQALGLSADPGGNCDIAATVGTGGNGAATAPIYLRVEYI